MCPPSTVSTTASYINHQPPHFLPLHHHHQCLTSFCLHKFSDLLILYFVGKVFIFSSTKQEKKTRFYNGGIEDESISGCCGCSHGRFCCSECGCSGRPSSKPCLWCHRFCTCCFRICCSFCFWVSLLNGSFILSSLWIFVAWVLENGYIPSSFAC